MSSNEKLNLRGLVFTLSLTLSLYLRGLFVGTEVWFVITFYVSLQKRKH